MVTSAPSINADGSPAASRCSSVPRVAAATGTPSCAPDSTARFSGSPNSPRGAVRKQCADSEADAQQDEPGPLTEFANLQ